jgi:hypothetical protein
MDAVKPDREAGVGEDAEAGDDDRDSKRDVCVGFKYLLMAADGSSSSAGGLRSSV